jgi:hypothetical protein
MIALRAVGFKNACPFFGFGGMVGRHCRFDFKRFNPNHYQAGFTPVAMNPLSTVGMTTKFQGAFAVGAG